MMLRSRQSSLMCRRASGSQKELYTTIVYGVVVLSFLLGEYTPRLRADDTLLYSKTEIANGSHPWYEVRADPEDPNNLIVCGTKWDSRENAFHGFVYASADAGSSWKLALEDTHSRWVSEQSCAFGTNHRVYFISEASKIVDGQPRHELGTTRLYVSRDGGQHWIETLKTGWADHSATAVSEPSGRVYTFFNIPYTQATGPKQSSNVGLLIFSPDGTTVIGPFVSSAIQRAGYRGVYPFFATGLRSGAVICLYHGISADGKKQDLALVRVDQSRHPLFESTVIARSALSKDCSSFERGSIAYDSQNNRLFVVYGDGCKSRHLMLTSSTDEGKTWTPAAALHVSESPNSVVVAPSLVVGSDRHLGLLWEDGWYSGRWLFSPLQSQRVSESATELSSGQREFQLSTDLLQTSIVPSHASQGDPHGTANSSVMLNVFNAASQVWRVVGLAAAGTKIVAVWPETDRDGMKLYSGVLGPPPLHGSQESAKEGDVTQHVLLEYGGSQEFQRATSTVDVCLVLGNQADRPLKVPIKLEVNRLMSSVGSPAVLNSTNGLTGIGATWDISNSVTGSQLPPLTKTNPFCLVFQIKGKDARLDSEELLSVGLRVLARE